MSEAKVSCFMDVEETSEEYNNYRYRSITEENHRRTVVRICIVSGEILNGRL
jgi:hypothetical protein